MSHIASIKIKIKDISALIAACAELGAEFRQGQTTYHWYGRRAGDSPLPEGMTEDMLGKCQHAIRIPGVKYEVGVVQTADGTYTLAWDEYGYDNGEHDGHKLIQKFGPQLGTLVQLYGVHQATALMQARGFKVQRKLGQDGAIELNARKTQLAGLAKVGAR